MYELADFLAIVCFNSLTVPTTEVPEAGKCTKPCTGNSTQTCGGAGNGNWGNLYSAPDTPPPSSSVSLLNSRLFACAGSSLVFSLLGSELMSVCNEDEENIRIRRRNSNVANRVESQSVVSLALTLFDAVTRDARRWSFEKDGSGMW